MSKAGPEYASDTEVMGRIEFGDELIDELLEQNPGVSLRSAQYAAGRAAREIYPIVEQLSKTSLPQVDIVTSVNGLKLELHHKREDV